MARGRAANGQGGLRYKVKNGVKYYEYRYTDPLTGKQTSKGTNAKTAAECLAKWDRIKASMTMGTFVSVDNKTLSAWFDEWMEQKRRDLEPHTWAKYESAGRLYIKPILGSMRLQDIRRVHCQEFVNRIRENLAAKTVHNHVGVLTAMLNDAVKHDLISRNPADDLDLPRVEKREPVVMEAEVQQAFEQAVRESPYRNIFMFSVHTGMRISEVLGLQWENVNMKTGEIVVTSQLERKGKDIERQIKQTTKSHKRRSFFLPRFVIENVLKQEKRVQAANKLQAGELWQNDAGLVFTRGDGSPMPHRTVEHAFERIVKKLGHPELTPHTMRKTFITNEEQAGIDIKTLADSVGHSTTSITLDVYTAATRESKRAAADRRQAEYEKKNG